MVAEKLMKLVKLVDLYGLLAAQIAGGVLGGVDPP
jgi:hypothetical protein